MKKTLNLIIIYLLLPYFLNTNDGPLAADYLGDFIFSKNNSQGLHLYLKVKIFSLPFEGMTNRQSNIFNRLDSIQNGSIFRHLAGVSWPPGVNESQIVYYTAYSGPDSAYKVLLDLGCCMNGEFPGDDLAGLSGAYGFGIYQITFDVPETNEHYLFYWNNLDTKYGKPNWNGETVYGRDWLIKYNGNFDVGKRVTISAATPDGRTFDTIDATNEYGKVIKMWKLIYNRENPFCDSFFVRTSPFPVNPNMLYNNYELRTFVVGTKVIFDNCINNTGQYDRWGYNTYDGSLIYPPNNYYSAPPIPPGSNSPGNTFTTPAYYYQNPYNPVDIRYGTKITAQNGDKIILKSNKKLWVSGNFDNIISQTWKGDTLIFSPGSLLEKEANAMINTCFGGVLIDSGANTVWGNYSRHQAYAFSSLEYYGGEHIVNNKGTIVINNNAKLKLGDNTTLTFDSIGAFLWLESGSQVILGNNAQIKFKNGAYLNANGADFSCSNGNWQGIVFENAGLSNVIIQNCTFSNAVVALNFNNTNISSLTNAVYNNTFNVPAVTWAKGIYARNLYNATFSHNTFNLSAGNTIGAIFQNSENPPEPGGDQVSELKFINNNTFTGGYIQLFIGGYASNNIPILVDGNTFTNGGWCFVGRMVTGSIKNNTMTRNSSNHAAWLYQSNPDMTNNTIRNNSGNGLFLTASYPVLGPTIDGSNRFVWFGGVNNIISVNGDALNINYSKPVLDNGANNLTISNSTYYHLYGLMNGTETFYNARNNCWYYNTSAGTPRIYVYNSNNNIVSVNTSGTIICNTQINYNSFIINDHGDGVSDTVWISDNTTGTPASDDEVLYTQAALYRDEGFYFDAITDFKNLINTYEESEYLYTSLYDLYACYEGLDTSDQAHRDLIFSDLKFYLENKILQYADNDEFVSIAYNLILMCETMIQNYNEAMDGYEFISLYHPDPEQRMWASMDYGEIQNLLNGMGGGESSNPKLVKKSNVLKLMDKKPYTRIVKNIFTKASKELDKKLNDKNLSEDRQIIQKKELIERARQNINVSRSLTKEQREERRMEDIVLLIKPSDNIAADNTPNIPQRYSLHQNYPNPFNPSTTIKYELPYDGVIKFKIYDILGKEIYSENEFKKAGIHTIMFDGSKYASGIYFYRLESGSYTETKKMVLIK